MRFDPASSLHMLFMRFAIDVIYFDRDERVVKLVAGPQAVAVHRRTRRPRRVRAAVGCDRHDRHRGWRRTRPRAGRAARGSGVSAEPAAPTTAVAAPERRRRVPLTLMTSTAALGFAVALGAPQDPGAEVVAWAAIALMLVAAAEDLRTRRLRNAFVGPALVFAIAADPGWATAAAAAIVVSPFLLFALWKHGSIGMGDRQVRGARWRARRSRGRRLVAGGDSRCSAACCRSSRSPALADRARWLTVPRSPSEHCSSRSS